MFDLKKKRKSKEEMKQKNIDIKEQTDISKTAIKKLSLSFYGENIIRKDKQIIFDHYDLTDDLQLLTEQMKIKDTKKRKLGSGHSVQSKSIKTGT